MTSDVKLMLQYENIWGATYLGVTEGENHRTKDYPLAVMKDEFITAKRELQINHLMLMFCVLAFH